MIDSQRKKVILVTVFIGIVVTMTAAPVLVVCGVGARYVVADLLAVVALVIGFAIKGVDLI